MLNELHAAHHPIFKQAEACKLEVKLFNDSDEFAKKSGIPWRFNEIENEKDVYTWIEYYRIWAMENVPFWAAEQTWYEPLKHTLWLRRNPPSRMSLIDVSESDDLK